MNLLILVLLFGLIVVLPVVLVARSDRVEGSSKAIWVIGTLIGSWLAYLAFVIATEPTTAPD